MYDRAPKKLKRGYEANWRVGPGSSDQRSFAGAKRSVSGQVAATLGRVLQASCEQPQKLMGGLQEMLLEDFRRG